MQRDASALGINQTYNTFTRNVANFPADGEFRSLVFLVQLGGHEWIAHCNIPARAQKNFLPNPHVLVRRSGVPINPGDAQVILSRGEYLDRECISLPRLQEFAYVEFVGAV